MDSEEARQSTNPSGWERQYSRLARRTQSPAISWLMAQALEVPGLISLAAGFVDQDSLPRREIAPLLRELMEQASTGQAALQYGTTAGDLELRAELVIRLRNEGVFHADAEVDAARALIGSGSQQLLYLAAETLLDEGDIVLVEAPTYFVVLGGFLSRGAQVIGIDTDEQGIRPEKVAECLERLQRQGHLPRVKMLYVMTYATNPLGVTLSLERRQELMNIVWSYRDIGHPILLVEDAAYRRLSFDPVPLPPVKSFDFDNKSVLYLESFSKSLSPGFRLGFGAGPKAIVDKMVDIKGNHDFGSGNLSQQLLKAVLREGFFDRHTETLRQVYRSKRDITWEILQDTLPPEADWYLPQGGFYFWITLPARIDTGPGGDLFRRALEEKVLYVPGCLCYSPDRPEARQSSALRLSYGMIGKDKLREGCLRLGAALAPLAVPIP
ncbi:MAG: PLP-dependent aminotransferase family protein [bacterium]